MTPTGQQPTLATWKSLGEYVEVILMSDMPQFAKEQMSNWSLEDSPDPYLR